MKIGEVSQSLVIHKGPLHTTQHPTPIREPSYMYNQLVPHVVPPGAASFTGMHKALLIDYTFVTVSKLALDACVTCFVFIIFIQTCTA